MAAAAVRRLALAALLQDQLAEDSPAAEDGVKLLDVLPEVAAATKAVRAMLLPACHAARRYAATPQTRAILLSTCAQGH